MSDQTAQGTQPRGLLQKRITVKWTLILLGIVIIAGFVFWAIKAVECGSIANDCRRDIRTCTSRAAGNMARAIAVVGNRQIVEKDYGNLRDYFDTLAKGDSVSYIAIVDSGGRAVVHTDRSVLGKRWSKPEENEGEVTASADVMDFTDQVATVYVGMRVR
ncbi:MAG: hypothetical protein A2Z18_04365 [Armatimonadetes bacterium RBG_16_58_9]|nr:MAG: hypothetical protein A2Z18_04365 [Armatimonadetes bacterium RBG_16_58_9]